MKKEFCSTNGCVKYAGTHIIVELWNAQNIFFLPKVKRILKDAIKTCKITLLNIGLHKLTSYIKYIDKKFKKLRLDYYNPQAYIGSVYLPIYTRRIAK